MKPRHVTVLWILAVALGLAVAYVKINRQSARDTATEREPGDTLIADFPAAEVASVSLADADRTITIHKKDGGWTVAGRDDYPARTTNVLSLLRTIGDLKIVQAIEAGPSFAPHFGMDPNADDAEEHGITATFADASGGEIARVSAGRTLESGGRYVRHHADESGFYAVNDMLFMLDADPIRWLDDTFIRLEKIASIHVAVADNPDGRLWHVTRDSEEGDFQLAAAAPGETLDATVGDALAGLMGFARFQDVVPAAEVEARTADTANPRIATVETFEGFTYTFTITPAKPGAAGAAPAEPYLLTVAVEANLPAGRKKTEDETGESAADLDKAFAERLETLTTRLEKERALAGRTFLVAKSVVEPLLNERDDILAGPPEEPTATTAAPTPTPAPAPAPAPATPRGRATVTTPPIEIPVAPPEDAGE